MTLIKLKDYALQLGIFPKVVEVMEMESNENGSNGLKELTFDETSEVNGGISLGVAIFAAIAQAITGEPAGVVLALTTITGAQGVDNLVALKDK